MAEDANIIIDIFTRDHALVVLVQGEVDLATSPRFREALSIAQASDAASIIVDLDQVTFMDSSGLHALVHYAVSDAMRHRMTVSRGSPQVLRLFEISGVGRYLSFTPSPRRAVIRGPGSTPEAPRSAARSDASRC